MNKKADQGTVMNKTLILILILVTIALVLLGLWRYGIIDKIKEQFPDFKQQELIKQMQDEQNNIPAQEKERDYGNRYLIVRLHYTEGVDDLFAFRWNSNPLVNKIQVVMNIGETTLAFGIPTSYITKEWIINPNDFEQFSKGTGLYDYEKNDVMKIMISKNESDMISRISEAAKRDNVYIEFPQYNIDSWKYEDTIQKFNRLSKDEIQSKLKEINPWYYK